MVTQRYISLISLNNMEKKKKKQFYLLALIAFTFLVIICGSLFTAFAGSQERIVYLDNDDNLDSVYAKTAEHRSALSRPAFTVLSTVTGYGSHIRPGRYDVGSGASTLSVFRRLRNGSQTPVRLTIPILRTQQDLADFLAKNFQASAEAFEAVLNDTALLAKYDKTPATAVCLFVPNTYEFFWNIKPATLIERMHEEYLRFWSGKRAAEAKALGLTPDEVTTVASIVEQETAFNPEKPMVAGMYLNRLTQNMPLQADPTVKFALGDFALRRILHEHLRVDSPYNTYKVKGLPPGPICIPSVVSIDAVLHRANHTYLYMCAKEDFSGSHNFATTYAEHQQNAAKYAAALNARGIRS